MTPAFANPVNGFIHDGAWVRPALSHEFKVTSTFAQHVASGRGAGIDIGNGHCGDPVLAMAGGVVSYSGPIGAVDANGKPLPNPALLVRVRHPQFPGYETGYLHLATIEVRLGQIVLTSQPIGTHGSTGASACHLHGGCKFNGVEVDWWPLLAQNQEDAMPGFKATAPAIGMFQMPPGGHALISPTDTKQRFPQPAGGTFVVFASLDLLTDIDGHTPPQNGREQVYLVDGPKFGAAAYALRSDGVFTPIPAGHSDADLAKAAADAEWANEAKWEQWVATHP